MNNLDKLIQRFRDYGLSDLLEAIAPIKTSYGSDLKNHEWLILDDANKIKQKKSNELHGKLIYTFFTLNNIYYQVYIINNGTWCEIGFATSTTFDSNNPSDFENLRRFNWHPIKGSNAYSVFNRIFFIALEGLNKYNIQKIVFRGLPDTNLGELYSKMMKQGSLEEILNKYGYTFEGETENGYFLFRRTLSR